MSDAFRAYPEIVFINATYKLLELGIPMYLFVRGFKWPKCDRWRFPSCVRRRQLYEVDGGHVQEK